MARYVHSMTGEVAVSSFGALATANTHSPAPNTVYSPNCPGSQPGKRPVSFWSAKRSVSVRTSGVSSRIAAISRSHGR
jgi:hypothetical protein